MFYGHDRAGACMNSRQLCLHAQDQHEMEQDKITAWMREELPKSHLLFAKKLLILEKCWGKESQFSSSFSFVFWGIMLTENKTDRNALSHTGSASSQA